MPETISKPGTSSVIRFNVNEDEHIRGLARRGHELSKVFKAAGIKFKRVIPAASDQSVKKLFRLGQNPAHICIEIRQDGDEIKDKLAIEDVKTHLINMDTFRLIDEKAFQYDKLTKVYRFLLLYESSNKSESDDKNKAEPKAP